MGKQEYPTGCREELEDARGSNSGQRALDGRVKACGRGRRSVRVGLFLTVLFITVACLWGSKEPEQPTRDKKRLHTIHTSLAERSARSVAHNTPDALGQLDYQCRQPGSPLVRGFVFMLAGLRARVLRARDFSLSTYVVTVIDSFPIHVDSGERERRGEICP